MKSFFVLLFLILAPIVIIAQEPLRFKTTFNDVGCCRNDQDSVSCLVKYYNIGTHPLYVTKFVSNCHCTIGEYSREPLAPGDSAYLKITHHFRDIGQFIYQVRLYYHYNEEDDYSNWISISGKVEETTDADKERNNRRNEVK